MIQQDPRELRSAGSPHSAGHARTVQHIVVPLDGSAFAERALGWAVPIARGCGAEIVLVRAYTQREDYHGSHYPLPWRRERDGLHAASLYLARQEHELRRRGVRVTPRTAQGEPAEVIAAVVAQCDADLLILATHNRHASPLAGVAQAVISQCDVPALLLTAETHAPRSERHAMAVLLPHEPTNTAERTRAEEYSNVLAAALGGPALAAPAEGDTTADVGVVVLPMSGARQARAAHVRGALRIVALGGTALLLIPQTHDEAEGGRA